MWSPSRRIPSVTSAIGISLERARISARLLLCRGSRCWTNTKAMPVSLGRRCSRSVNASKPPAEAPIPTTRRSLSGRFAVRTRFFLPAGLAGVFLPVLGFVPVLAFLVVDGRFFGVLAPGDPLAAEDAVFLFFAARFDPPLDSGEVDFFATIFDTSR